MTDKPMGNETLRTFCAVRDCPVWRLIEMDEYQRTELKSPAREVCQTGCLAPAYEYHAWLKRTNRKITK